MKRKHVIVAGLAVIVLAAVAGLLAKTSQTVKTGNREVPLAQVQRGDLDIKVYATGALRATHSMVLTAPPVGGGALQITRLLHTGAAVKKGDIVFEFDPAEQRYNLEQSRSELLEAQQEITKAQADAAVLAAQDKVALLKARFDARRAELEVGKNELVSVIDAKKNDLALEQAKRALTQLQHDIESHTASGQATIVLAKEKENKAKLAMDLAQLNIKKMQVAAPMDGLVSIQRNIAAMQIGWPGMTVPDYRAGDQVQSGTAVAEVIDSSQMELTSKIGEQERGNVKVGQSAEVEFDALPGRIFPGTVKTVGGMSTKQFWEANTQGKFDIAIPVVNPRPATASWSYGRNRRPRGQEKKRGVCPPAGVVHARREAHCLREKWHGLRAAGSPDPVRDREPRGHRRIENRRSGRLARPHGAAERPPPSSTLGGGAKP